MGMFFTCAKFHELAPPLAGDMGGKPIFGLRIFQGPSCVPGHCFAASSELVYQPMATAPVPYETVSGARQ